MPRSSARDLEACKRTRRTRLLRSTSNQSHLFEYDLSFLDDESENENEKTESDNQDSDSFSNNSSDNTQISSHIEKPKSTRNKTKKKYNNFNISALDRHTKPSSNPANHQQPSSTSIEEKFRKELLQLWETQKEILKELKTLRRCINENENVQTTLNDKKIVSGLVRNVYKLSGKKWIIGNKMRWTSEPNVPISRKILKIVSRILGPNADRRQIIEAIKAYFKNLRQVQRIKKNLNEDEYRRVCRLQSRKKIKLEKRRKAVEYLQGCSQKNKKMILDALQPPCMSSEDSDSDGTSGVLVVKRYTWRSRMYQEILDKLDDIIWQRRKRGGRGRPYCPRRYGEVYERDAPECLAKHKWAVGVKN